MSMLKPMLVTACVIIAGSPAAAQESNTERQFFQLPEMAALNLPFSDAVLVGDTLYLSGAGGIDVTTMTVPEDPQEETRLLMENFIKGQKE